MDGQSRHGAMAAPPASGDGLRQHLCQKKLSESGRRWIIDAMVLRFWHRLHLWLALAGTLFVGHLVCQPVPYGFRNNRQQSNTNRSSRSSYLFMRHVATER